MGGDVHVDLDLGTIQKTATCDNMQSMGTVLVEIRAAEGGLDAKLLVTDQYRIYQKWMTLERL